MDLCERVYLLTRGFPSHETYGLAAQIRRAAVSVPSNIAEGHAREHTKEYLYHLSVAQGSLAELGTQLEIAARLLYVTPDNLAPTLDQAASVAKQLFALRNALTRYVET